MAGQGGGNLGGINEAAVADSDKEDLGGGGGPSAGDVGGMGGVRGHTGASSRPPGGVSPVQPDRDEG